MQKFKKPVDGRIIFNWEDTLKKDSKVGNKKSPFSTTISAIIYKYISEIKKRAGRLLPENKEEVNKIDLEDFDAEVLDEKRDNTEFKAKKHIFFEKGKTFKIKEKKGKNDIDRSSSFLDDLAELKNKYGEHLIFSNLDSGETDVIGKDGARLDNKKIWEISLTGDVKGDRIDRGEKQIDKSEKRKFFFKRKKTSKVEEVKEEEDTVDSEKPIGKLEFRVENLPATDKVSEDEARLLDKKIKENHVTSDLGSGTDELELKAKKLAEEHIKNKPFAREESITKSDETTEAYNSADVSPGEDDAEHVFFDEADISFGGWSPETSEEEKKDALLHPSVHPEVESIGLRRDERDDIELPKEVLQVKSIKLTDLGFSENEWEELDFYPLIEPFAYVEILRDRESLDKRYFLVEIGLTPAEQKMSEFILDTMGGLTIDTMDLESRGDNRYLMEGIEQIIEDYDIKLDSASKSKILYYIKKTSLGLGKIDPLMKDPNIEDISCDGANVPLFLYHREYGSLKSNIEFNDEDELSSFIFKLAQKCGKHISIAEPMLDATMPDGSRIQMTLSDEVTTKGSTFSIRKFSENPFSPPDLVEFNTMSSEMIAYMWLAVENGINMLIAGGTASGKTTVLNALSLFIPREVKIVSIEETREINLPHPNWIPGVARSGFGEVVDDKIVGEIDMYDLMKAALRQRPEYILVGEIRGREAYVLFQAMATGHATYSTVHADSPQSLIHRLEGKPINIPRVMLQSLDIVSLHVITRVKNKRARRCKQIIEIIDIDPTTKEILTNEVFRWDPIEDKFIYSGKSYVLERIRAEKDLSGEEMTNEIKNRKNIVEWMNTKNIREFKKVAKIIAQYIEDPDNVLKQIEKDVS